jgi:AraC-like DNA-binding protein
VTLASAAAELDRSVPHLVRSFTREFGLSPHAYLTGRRVDMARRLLLHGTAPADVATAVGFYDQAHLTRHFKRHTSATPSSYARSRSRGLCGDGARQDAEEYGRNRHATVTIKYHRWSAG